MKYTEVLALINAGYTKAEIEAMTAPEPQQIAPEPEPAFENCVNLAGDKTEPAFENCVNLAGDKTEPEPNQQENSMLTMLQEMIQQNQNMLQAMQAANIRAARQPEQEPEASPEDLIAKIIAPTPQKKK